MCVLGHLVNFISNCGLGSKKFEKLSWKDFFAPGIDSRFQLLPQGPSLETDVVRELFLKSSRVRLSQRDPGRSAAAHPLLRLSLCQVFAAAEGCGEKPGEPPQGMGAEVGFPSVSPGMTPGVQRVQPLALSLSRFLTISCFYMQVRAGRGRPSRLTILPCYVFQVHWAGG